MAQTGCITITEATYIGDKMFRPNEQYNYVDIVKAQSGCSCNGSLKITEHYKVVCKNKAYLIPANKAVKTTVPIPLVDQSFADVIKNDFLQNKEHHDYSSINNNCINCNQSIVHGDYNNDINTGGFKDPQLVSKDEDNQV